MPYSRSAQYLHHRQRTPSKFVASTFRNITIERAQAEGLYRGHKWLRPGVRAVVGRLKRGGTAIQSILEPKFPLDVRKSARRHAPKYRRGTR